MDFWYTLTMPKWTLYIIILALLGVILYLTTDIENFFKSEERAEETKIEVSEPVITRTEPAPSTTDASGADEKELIAISGRLVRFEEGTDAKRGRLVVYALIDDGTEFIRVDMHEIVEPGVSAPEDQLGFKLGQTVTIHGELDDGVFVAREID